MEEKRFPTLNSQNFRDIKFWEMKLSVSSSAALWIIKRHVVVDLESSCRVDPCEFAADSGRIWKLYWLDDNQTATREEKKKRPGAGNQTESAATEESCHCGEKTCCKHVRSRT